jgi:hypothetical protein
MRVYIRTINDGGMPVRQYIADDGEPFTLGTEAEVLRRLNVHPAVLKEYAGVKLTKEYAQKRLAHWMAKQIGTDVKQLKKGWEAQ